MMYDNIEKTKDQTTAYNSLWWMWDINKEYLKVTQNYCVAT